MQKCLNNELQISHCQYINPQCFNLPRQISSQTQRNSKHIRLKNRLYRLGDIYKGELFIILK